MKKAVLALICMAIACAALAGSPARAQNSFGAIALSESTYAFGWSGDKLSRQAAERIALRNCYQYADDCRIVMWTRNACMALAIGDESWGTSWNTVKSKAINHAMALCQENSDGCRLALRQCSK